MSQWRGTGANHQGLVRSTNQDAVLIENDLCLWGVADGMGGHPGGDVASRLVMETIAQLAHADCDRLHAAAEVVVQTLRDMVESAHHAILEYARQHAEFTGMGTTLTLLKIVPGPIPVAVIVHEGDSRAYLVRDGMLKQVTSDHSVVEDYVRLGILTPSQALHHPERHILSKALGLGLQSDVDVTTQMLTPGDLLLLCTDGLTKMLHDTQIQQHVEACGPYPDAVCDDLMKAALEAGGLDNITVVVIGHH